MKYFQKFSKILLIVLFIIYFTTPVNCDKQKDDDDCFWNPNDDDCKNPFDDDDLKTWVIIVIVIGVIITVLPCIACIICFIACGRICCWQRKQKGSTHQVPITNPVLIQPQQPQQPSMHVINIAPNPNNSSQMPQQQQQYPGPSYSQQPPNYSYNPAGQNQAYPMYNQPIHEKLGHQNNYPQQAPSAPNRF